MADDAVNIAGERIGECFAPQAAVVAGIFTQRSSELLDAMPADNPIDMAAELAKLDRRLELLKALIELPQAGAGQRNGSVDRNAGAAALGPCPEWLGGALGSSSGFMVVTYVTDARCHSS